MPTQVFQAPVGQVAAGNIHNNQSRWDHHTHQELKHIRSAYSKERAKVWVRQFLNLHAAGLTLTLALLGVWGSHMIQTSGLVGEIPPERIAILCAFVAMAALFIFGLHRLRVNARATLAELDEDLKHISQAIRYKKSAGKKPL